MEAGIVTTHIPPAKGYGGVSVTASVLTKAWAEQGHKMVLVASDESIDGRLRAEHVKLGEQVEVQLYHCYGFRRWGFGLGAIPKLFKLCLQAPVVYIHGIATWPSTLAAIFCILLVPNGIDSRDIQVTHYPAGEGLKLCFLGHIQQEKGINAFIRAWLKIRHRRINW